MAPRGARTLSPATSSAAPRVRMIDSVDLLIAEREVYCGDLVHWIGTVYCKPSLLSLFWMDHRRITMEDEHVETAVEDVALSLVDQSSSAEQKKLKRLCRYPGCTRVIKSQGHCQRHGAKAKRCRVDGCDKQAQGTHDGMCKRHWKAIHFPEAPKADDQPPAPEGESVYDSILPQSIAYRPGHAAARLKEGDENKNADPWDPPAAPEGSSVMPLVGFLKSGAHKEAGWHRNLERRARGMFPIPSLSCQLEPWERQLVRDRFGFVLAQHGFLSFSCVAGPCRDSPLERRYTLRQFQR